MLTCHLYTAKWAGLVRREGPLCGEKRERRGREERREGKRREEKRVREGFDFAKK